MIEGINVDVLRLMALHGGRDSFVELSKYWNSLDNDSRRKTLQAISEADDPIYATLVTETIKSGVFSPEIVQLAGQFRMTEISSVIKENFSSFDDATRASAVEALNQLDRKWITSIASEMFNSSGPQTRAALLQMLGKEKNPLAAALAGRSITSSDERIQVAAVTALAEAGEIHQLVRLLGQRNQNIKIRALSCLSTAEISERYQNNVRSAVTELLSDPAPAVRISALKALDRLDSRAMKAVVTLWRTIPAFYMNAVEEHIVRLCSDSENLMELLQADVEEYILAEALEAVKNVGEDEFIVLIRRGMSKHSMTEGYRAKLLGNVQKYKTRTGIYFLELLDSIVKEEWPELTENLLEALQKYNRCAEIRPERSMGHEEMARTLKLISALKSDSGRSYLGVLLYSPSRMVRMEAFQTISALEAREHVDCLMTLLTGSEDNMIRAASARTLSKLKHQPAVKQFMFMTGQKDLTLKLAVLEGIRVLSDARSAAIFYSALESPEEAVRVQALKALENFKMEESFRKIITAAGDSSPLVKAEVCRILIKTGEEMGWDMLENMLESHDSKLRTVALETASNLEDIRNKYLLVQMLDDEDKGIIRRAYSLLKNLAPREDTFNALKDYALKCFKVSDPSSEEVDSESKVDESSGSSGDNIHSAETEDLSDMVCTENMPSYVEDLKERYGKLKCIGAGGMGRVFRGTDSDGKVIAVKVLDERYWKNRKVLRRFIQREGQAVLGIDHPGIIKVFSVESEDIPLITMEYISGMSLRDYLKKYGRMDSHKAASIIAVTLDALYYAHQAGIIHRDIKPDNIMLTEDENPKIMDFGLTRIQDQTVMTETGELFGTMFYMPPEQIRGMTADERSDIYALGVTFYELVTGRVPFPGSTPEQVMYKLFHEEPVLPSAICTNLSEELEKVIMAMFAREPENRPDNASEAAEMIRNVLKE